MGPADDVLLLFRKVTTPARRAVAARLLHEGMGADGWGAGSEVDLWELGDVTSGDDEEPAAAAATCDLDDGSRVQLLAVVVGAGRGHALGPRLLEALADALRARGVLVLVTAVPADHFPAMAVVERAGFRPSHVERAGRATGGPDLVWFDVEL